MSSNICGNCENFKPNPGEKLFNCTHASHAGLKYGMQVRADTRSCDAFVPLSGPPPSHTPSAEPPPMPAEERQQPVRLCSRGRTILIAGLAIAVLLISWLLYTCASALISTPSPTPTPVLTPTGPLPSPTAIGPPTPTPTATPLPYLYLELGQWAVTSREMVTIAAAKRVRSYMRYGATIRAEAGTVFIIIDVSITNIGDTNLSVGPNQFTLQDSDGRVYTQGGYRAEGGLPSGKLPKGQTTGGKVLFQVPMPVSGLTIIHNMQGTPDTQTRWQLDW